VRILSVLELCLHIVLRRLGGKQVSVHGQELQSSAPTVWPLTASFGGIAAASLPSLPCSCGDAGRTPRCGSVVKGHPCFGVFAPAPWAPQQATARMVFAVSLAAMASMFLLGIKYPFVFCFGIHMPSGV
jgi:hypothetical protein